MSTETRVSPYPIELLTSEQLPIYHEWKYLFDISNNPPHPDLEIGTIIIPTGDWLDRVPPALYLFKDKFHFQINPPKLVISGATSHPDMPSGGARADKIARAIEIYGKLTNIMKNEVITDTESIGTKQQSENIYGLLDTGHIQEPIVAVVSTYHLPRLYSTFVKTILDHEVSLKTRLYCLPVSLNWQGIIPKEPRGIRYQQIFPEMDRIHQYRLKKDVATEEELNYYVDWLKAN